MITKIIYGNYRNHAISVYEEYGCLYKAATGINDELVYTDSYTTKEEAINAVKVIIRMEYGRESKFVFKQD